MSAKKEPSGSPSVLTKTSTESSLPAPGVPFRHILFTACSTPPERLLLKHPMESNGALMDVYTDGHITIYTKHRAGGEKCTKQSKKSKGSSRKSASAVTDNTNHTDANVHPNKEQSSAGEKAKKGESPAETEDLSAHSAKAQGLSIALAKEEQQSAPSADTHDLPAPTATIDDVSSAKAGDKSVTSSQVADLTSPSAKTEGTSTASAKTHDLSAPSAEIEDLTTPSPEKEDTSTASAAAEVERPVISLDNKAWSVASDTLENLREGVFSGADERSRQWTCRACTFLNDAAAKRCGMCRARRPAASYRLHTREEGVKGSKLSGLRRRATMALARAMSRHRFSMVDAKDADGMFILSSVAALVPAGLSDPQPDDSSSPHSDSHRKSTVASSAGDADTRDQRHKAQSDQHPDHANDDPSHPITSDPDRTVGGDADSNRNPDSQVDMDINNQSTSNSSASFNSQNVDAELCNDRDIHSLRADLQTSSAAHPASSAVSQNQIRRRMSQSMTQHPEVRVMKVVSPMNKTVPEDKIVDLTFDDDSYQELPSNKDSYAGAEPPLRPMVPRPPDIPVEGGLPAHEVAAPELHATHAQPSMSRAPMSRRELAQHHNAFNLQRHVHASQHQHQPRPIAHNAFHLAKRRRSNQQHHHSGSDLRVATRHTTPTHLSYEGHDTFKLVRSHNTDRYHARLAVLRGVHLEAYQRVHLVQSEMADALQVFRFDDWRHFVHGNFAKLTVQGRSRMARIIGAIFVEKQVYRVDATRGSVLTCVMVQFKCGEEIWLKKITCVSEDLLNEEDHEMWMQSVAASHGELLTGREMAEQYDRLSAARELLARKRRILINHTNRSRSAAPGWQQQTPWARRPMPDPHNRNALNIHSRRPGARPSGPYWQPRGSHNQRMPPPSLHPPPPRQIPPASARVNMAYNGGGRGPPIQHATRLPMHNTGHFRPQTGQRPPPPASTGVVLPRALARTARLSQRSTSTHHHFF